MTAHRFQSILISSTLASLWIMTAPDIARSAPCYYEDSGSYYPERVECESTASATSSLGQTLQSLGESFVQQQLSFGALGAFAGPTGRLRHTAHDGLRVKGINRRTSEFEVDEGSVFANGSYDLPGTVFGGRVRVSGLVGYTRLEQEDNVIKTEIDSAIYGGSYLWSKGQFYTMALVIGLHGEAHGSDGLDAFDHDVHGYFANAVAGYTFDLMGGTRFDLRAGLGRYDVETGSFVIERFTGEAMKGFSDASHASLTGTLFTLIETGGGTMRPYVLASYKNVFGETIRTVGALDASFSQADDYGKVEFGFDYGAGRVTYGGAAYTEFSADETTFGARLGLSVKLQ